MYDGPFDWRKLYYKNVCHQAIFYRRRVFDRVGRFNLRYRFLSDRDFNFRVFGDASLRKRYVNELIAVFSAEGASFTHRDVPFSQDRDRLFREAFGLRRWLALKALGRVSRERSRLSDVTRARLGALRRVVDRLRQRPRPG